MEAYTEEDFADFALCEEGEFQVKDPNGQDLLFKGNPVFVVVHGPGSETYDLAIRQMEKRTTKELTKLALSGKQIDDDLLAEASVKRTRELVLELTKEIKNFPHPKGKEFILTSGKFSYIQRQIEEYLNKMGNFYGVKKNP